MVTCLHTSTQAPLGYLKKKQALKLRNIKLLLEMDATHHKGGVISRPLFFPLPLDP